MTYNGCVLFVMYSPIKNSTISPFSVSLLHAQCRTVSPFLSITLGSMVYQNVLSKICSVVYNFSMGQVEWITWELILEYSPPQNFCAGRHCIFKLAYRNWLTSKYTNQILKNIIYIASPLGTQKIELIILHKYVNLLAPLSRHFLAISTFP